MNKIFQYYLSPTKIWTKEFSKKEIVKIFKAFMDATELTLEQLIEVAENKNISISYKEKSLNYPLMHISDSKKFPVPESDLYDEFLGIEPKTVKKILNNLNYDYEKFKEVLSLYSSLESYYIKDREGDINWDKTFKTLFKEFKGALNANSSGVHAHHGSKSIKTNPDFLDFLQNLVFYEKNIAGDENNLFFTGKHKELFELFSQYPHQDFLMYVENEKGKLEKIKNYSFDKMIDVYIHSLVSEKNIKKSINKAKTEWSKAFNYIPKAKYLLAVHPENVTFEITKKIEKKFGNLKNINNYQNAVLIVNLLNLFGKNLLEITEDYWLNEENLIKLANLIKTCPIERAKREKIINGNNKQLFLNLEFETLFLLMLLNKKIEEHLLENFYFMERLKKEFLKTIKANKCEEFVRLLNFFGLNFVKKILRYVQGYENLLDIMGEMKQIYQKRVQIKTIPSYFYKSGKYQAYTMDSNSVEGLLCGYETDCCMTIGGNGESCLKYGYKKHHSNFFIVKKKNRIVSFSWLWEFVDKKKKKILVLDSIEILGRDLEDSKNVLEIYFNLIKKMLFHYDLIIIGTDGNTTPEKIEIFGKIHNNYNKIKIPFKKIVKKLGIKYTDADHEFILIDNKNLKEIEEKIKTLQV